MQIIFKFSWFGVSLSCIVKFAVIQSLSRALSDLTIIESIYWVISLDHLNSLSRIYRFVQNLIYMSPHPTVSTSVTDNSRNNLRQSHPEHVIQLRQFLNAAARAHAQLV